MKPILKTALIVCCFSAMLAAASCNTTKGAGKDLESAGQGIQDAADRNGAK